MKIILATFCLWVAAAVSVWAMPLSYALDAGESRVGFEVPFGPDQITGTMPVRLADIALDFAQPSNSRISVVLDVGNAQANFPFATQALRGPRVLDAAAFPDITFVSNSIEVQRDAPSKARLGGDITIRGVTRPIVLDVELFRPAGRAPGERELLFVRLEGAVSRAAFGATGWDDLVGDEVSLDLMLRIDLEE
ncbi:MAG: YceI family protein [Boseongicola sp.]|nr:YceI family protein [Boseongicola sp.]